LHFIKNNYQASFVFSRLFHVLLLQQLADMLEVFTVRPVLSSTPPKYQQAAATYCAQFGLLYKFYTEEFPLAVLHARVQYIKHSIHTVTVLPDVGPVIPKTCSS